MTRPDEVTSIRKAAAVCNVTPPVGLSQRRMTSSVAHRVLRWTALLSSSHQVARDLARRGRRLRSTGSVSSSRTEAMSALWGHVEELQGNVVGILGVQVQAAFILDDP